MDAAEHAPGSDEAAGAEALIAAGRPNAVFGRLPSFVGSGTGGSDESASASHRT